MAFLLTLAITNFVLSPLGWTLMVIMFCGSPEIMLQRFGSELVVVPAGSFTMGSPESELLRESNESPQHAVTFARQFAVGRFALTFDEWDACVADGGCNGYRPND